MTTVRLYNHSTSPFLGWLRTTIDFEPPVQAGEVGPVQFVVGRRIGLDTRALDIRCALQPGEERVVDLSQATAKDMAPPALPADVLAHFGGPMVGDKDSATEVALKFVGAPMTDGVCWSARLRDDECTPTVEIMFRWNPQQPGWAHGEAIVTFSDPTSPDVEVTLDADYVLGFGDALVIPLGGKPGVLVTAGTRFADGQARVVPITFVWPRHLRTAEDWQSMLAAAFGGVSAVGIQKLLHQGNPRVAENVDWKRQFAVLWPQAISALHTWSPGPLGIPPRSGMTGEQQDQVLTGGEAMVCPGYEKLTRLAAYEWASRPCHHLEADGSPLDPKKHPNLRLWDGRPHWHAGVSPDRLGKPGPKYLVFEPSSDPNAVVVPGGWWGPDVEHHLINQLAAACRLTDSPACQWLLEAQATVYMLQQTWAAGASTSSAYASRAIGYEGINAVHYWRCLENRAKAEEVRQHFLQRWEKVLRPHLVNRTAWPDGFAEQGKVSPWQMALGAYGLDLAGEAFGIPEMRQIALRAAKWVCDRGYAIEGGRWRTYGTVMLATETPDPAANDIFHFFGMPMAPAVVLKHEPEHARARAIWTQQIADAREPKHLSWMCPAVT